ncbi:MAG: hypothetical protein ACKOPU_02045 [Candidatus Planktophila sp.]
MRKPRILAVLATSLALIFSTTQIASGENTDVAISYYDYLFQSKPEGMFYPRDTFVGFGTTAASFFGSTTTKGPDNVWKTVFQPCSAEIPDYCIESVAWRKLGSEKWNLGTVTDWKPNPSDPVLTSTTYTEASETQYRDFYINSETGLPRGGYVKVWNLPGASHGGGDNYTVAASIYYYKNINPPSLTQTFAVDIKPVKFDKTTPGGQSAWPFNYGTTYNFPKDLEYQAKVRMGKFKDQVGGWFNGRILDPSISQVGNTFTLSGTPTKVLAAHTGPISCENLKWSEVMTEKCANKDPLLNSMAVNVGTSILNSSIENALAKSTIYPNGSFAFFEPLMKPIGYTSEWNAVTWGINGSGNCQMEPGKIALVSSNATLYSAFPPAWDSVEQTLAYQVGSLHLDHTGALHKGHFNLAVPKTFAKCLWGENILKARATVAVTNADGSNNVATSVLSQDEQMIYFKVAGFTFSTPQIKVKLEVPKVEPTPTPTASVTATPTAKPLVKKTTITCVKGKVVKKVTAISPQCPSGYKKK